MVAGRPLALAMLDIHTVGAGGGSIAWRDPGGALRVGPHSAGADPGPACYGRGGEHPTVTDANLLLGRLPADTPLAGGLQLDREAAERAVGDSRRQQLGLADAALRRGHRAGRGGRDAASAAHDDGGARHRPARFRADALRRRRSPARRGARASAGDAAHPRPPRLGGALRARPRRRGAPPRRGAHGDARRGVPRRRSAWPRSAARWSPGPATSWATRPSESRSATSCATAGSPSSWRCRRRSCRHRPPRRHDHRYRPPRQPVRRADPHANTSPDAAPPTGTYRRAPGPDALCEAFAKAHEQRYGYRDDGVEVELVTIRASAVGAAPRAAS